MTVANGQLANAPTFNTSFLSREEDSNTVGKIDLDNTDPESGPAVENVQLQLNLALPTAPVIDAISPGGALTLDEFSMYERRRVRGAAGAITMADLAFGTGPFRDGKRIRLMGYHATQTVRLDDSSGDTDGIKINGGSVVLALHDIAEFDYDLDNRLWVLAVRNN
jgi:hypothetical protein